MIVDTDALALVVWVALVAAGCKRTARLVARLLGIDVESRTVIGKVRRPLRLMPMRPVPVRPAYAHPTPYRINRIRSFTG